MLKISPVDNKPKTVSKDFLKKLYKKENTIQKKALNYSNNTLLKMIYLAAEGALDSLDSEEVSLSSLFLKDDALSNLKLYINNLKYSLEQRSFHQVLLITGSTDSAEDILKSMSNSLDIPYRKANLKDMESIAPVLTPLDMIEEKSLEELEQERKNTTPPHLIPEIIVFTNPQLANEYVKHRSVFKVVVVVMNDKAEAMALTSSAEDTSNPLNPHHMEAPYFYLKIKNEDFWLDSVYSRVLKETLSSLGYRSDNIPSKKLFAKTGINFNPSILRSFLKRAEATTDLNRRPFDLSNLESFLEEQIKLRPAEKTQSVEIITPQKTFEDLILSTEKPSIEQLLSRLKNMGPLPDFMKKLRRNENKLIALFAGPPGTGKSASAEAIAKILKKELWVLDLGKAQDKYVGETEKILTDTFKKAELAEAVLLIDEVDTLIADRSGVAGSIPFYMERTNHLLNLFENYNGVLILTINNSTNIDSAFERRIDYKVQFEKPTKEGQIKILKTMLSPDAPLGEIDWENLLSGIDLSGGFLRIAVEKAYYRMKEKSEDKITHETLRWALEEVKNEGAVFKEKRKVIGINPEDT